MLPGDLAAADMTFMHSWPELGCALLHLLLLVSFSHTEEPLCKELGDPEIPQLYMDGDIKLGGIFYFHSSWKNMENTYEHKPLPLQCIR